MAKQSHVFDNYKDLHLGPGIIAGPDLPTGCQQSSKGGGGVPKYIEQVLGALGNFGLAYKQERL